MADNGNEIWQLGLDIGPYKAALKEALDAYNVFSDKFSKTLSVRIDPESLKALSTAIGAQMRQALSLVAGAEQEFHEESIARAKKVTSEIVASHVKGFQALPKGMREAREAASKELAAIVTDAQRSAEKVEEAVKKMSGRALARFGTTFGRLNPAGVSDVFPGSAQRDASLNNLTNLLFPTQAAKGTIRDNGQAAAAAKAADAQKKITREAEATAVAQGAIGNSLVKNLAFMAKYVLLYRVIHDSARAVQQFLEGFVSSGIEYTKQLETQQLALRGILAEQAKVTDSTGKELTGRAELNALTSVAKDQWQKIQQASLSVVGTTADLMQLYVGILPFTRKFGASLDDVQQMTKSTAVAARLLDISFQDARTAVASILQGRALTRNKLVGALGFTKEELAGLKDGGKLFEVLQARLSAFLQLSDEASQTFAALAESFKDFSGIIASGFTQPFVDVFKKLVIGLSDATSGFSLFEKTVNGLQIRPELKAFIDFTTNAFQQAVKPLQDYGRAIKGLQLTDFEAVVVAIQEAASAVLSLGLGLIKIAGAIARWVADNRLLLEITVKYGGALLLAIGTLQKMESATNAVVAQLPKLIAFFGQTEKAALSAAQATDSLGSGMVKAQTGASGLSNILKTFAVGFTVTAVLYGLEQLVTNLAKVKQTAMDAQRAIDGIKSGNTQETIAGVMSVLRTGNPAQRGDAATGLANYGLDLIGKYNTSLGGQAYSNIGTSAVKNYSFGADSLSAKVAADKDIEKTSKLLADELLKAGEEQKKMTAAAAKRDNAEVDKHAKLLASVNDRIAEIDAQLKAKSKARVALEERTQAPFDIRDSMSSVLAQRDSVIRQLQEVKGPTTLGGIKQAAELGGAGPLSGLVVALSKLLPKDALSNEDSIGKVIDKVKLRFDELQKFFDATKGGFEMLKRGMQPNVKIEPPPRTPAEEKTFTNLGPYKVRELERAAQMDISSEKVKAALKEQTEDRAAENILKIEQDLLAAKTKVWADEADRYEKFIAERTKADKEYQNKNKSKIENERQSFAAAVADAQAEAKRSEDQAIIDREKKKDAYDKALLAAKDNLNKLREGIFGSAEGAAGAKFEKQIDAITASLEPFKNVTTESGKAIADLEESLRSLKNPFVAKAGYESTISRTAKELETSRSIQAILQRNLENGQVTVTQYLSRIRQLRADQVSFLQQQISAYTGLAGQKQAGIDAEQAKGLAADPETIAQMAMEMAAFRAQAARADDEIKDILDRSKRIRDAIKAWDALTQNVLGFLAAGEGLEHSNTFLEKMIKNVTSLIGLFDKIIKSAQSFAEISKSFNTFTALFKDAGGGSAIMSGLRTVGGLFGLGKPTNVPGIQPTPLPSFGRTVGPFSALDMPSLGARGAGAATAGSAGAAGAGSTISKVSGTLAVVGIAVAAGMAIYVAKFQAAVRKAETNIKESFDHLSKQIASGGLTLGEGLAALTKERDRIVKQYSSSKSGRAALKDLLPQIDDQIAQMKQQAADAAKAWKALFDKMIDRGGKGVGVGVFGDFYRELLDLQETINNYLQSIDTSTAAGMAKYKDALEQVKTFRDEWFREAKQKFQEEELGFEGEALSAQERYFSLLDEQANLYKELRDVSEQRVTLEENIADEQDRRAEFQKQQNELAKKELDLRKQIADVMKKAAADEDSIRRRGVLEAQLTIAQQKAQEINQVRNDAQSQVDALNQQIEDLKQQALDAAKAEDKQEKRKDRDLELQKRSLNERETDIQKQLRLNRIKLEGAKTIAELEGGVFGMATDEFDLAERQNALAIQTAAIQVQKWKDTKALIDAITETVDGVFFDPPEGFPQIKVVLGDITIDNRDQSTINLDNSTTTTGDGGGDGKPGRPDPTPDDSGDPRGPRRRKTLTGGGGSGSGPSGGPGFGSFTEMERKFPR
jgi:hypothetical protein